MTLPVAGLTRSQPRQTTATSRFKGTDLLEIVTTAAGQVYAPGSIITSGGITAYSSARLETIAKAYQRVKFHSLRFTIEGAYSSTSGGGYITCFVRDPDDVPPEDPVAAMKWAMSQQHSADAKWWDSVGLNVGTTPDLLFTSPGSSARLFSPGTFYVISKGGPAQVGTLTISYHWDVTLSEPTSETALTSNEIWTCPEDFVVPFAATAGAFTLQRVTTFSPDPHGVVTAHVTPVSAGLTGKSLGTYLRLKTPRMVTGEYNTGNDYIPVYVNGFYIRGDDLVAVSEIAGKFVHLSQGPATGVLSGYEASDWHILSGGYGSLVEEGEELDVFDVPSQVNSLDARKTKKFYGTKDQTSVTINPNVAIVNLTGEQ